MTVSAGLTMILCWSAIIALTLYCFVKIIHAKKKMTAAGSSDGQGREVWASRFGLIMAMAGNAIGLGNFLRFPVKAAQNGGGAFMIPYFCALLLLGVPMMWVEWTIGRYGGRYGHGSTPGMLHVLWKNRLAKYLGALGIFLPFSIAVYYIFIESWTLAYTFFSGTGRYWGLGSQDAMARFLAGYQGRESNEFFSTILLAVIFLLITVACNYYFLYKGISKGIELLGKIGMPLLFIFAVMLVIRILTLGAPDPALPENNVWRGMAYIWQPDFSLLKNANVWLAAAGQIFFTLSLGQGMLNTYASYLKEKDDVALNGLSTAATNEFAEVILGGTIAIPVAVAFFGLSQTRLIAAGGSFNLGFVSMPVIFQKLPLGQLFGSMWFMLLFIAGITSSVALSSPLVAFLQDELGWSRKKAVNRVIAFMVLATSLVVAFFRFGFLDEMDFWLGTFGICVFAAIEIVVFSWVFGVKRGWEELHKGADIRVPGIFKFVLRYVTPVYLLVLLGAWTYQEAIGKFFMRGEATQNKPYLWGARALMAIILLTTLWLVHYAWKRKKTPVQE